MVITMEGGDGMVAVVRGMRDAGLAVTLLDGTTHYTLMPNPVSHQSEQKHVGTTCSHQSSQHCGSSEVCADAANRCDSSAQATDGRYATIYKVAHCHVTPTSPPVQLTEFPPQRAEICRGQGNFEVGGSGSGESTYSPTRVNGSYRGGMSWPDRGSVCTPRSSHEPDAFANSLRKYSNISPERSAEIVERLISYTQAKNISKSRGCTSSTRNLELNSSSQTLDRHYSKNIMSRSPQRCYEQEINLRARIRTEESPTRDGKPKRKSDCEFWDRRPIFTRNYDEKFNSDAYRRNREVTTNKNIANSTISVNMEVQAAVPMVSKEVATQQQIAPSRRTVAVPLSPSSSSPDRAQEGESKRLENQTEISSSFKYVQTTISLLNLTKSLRESIQTTSSFSKMPNLMHDNVSSVQNSRKSKSQEELTRNNDNISKKLLKLLKDLTFYPNMKNQNRDAHTKEQYNGNYDFQCGERIKIKFGRCVKKLSDENNCRKLREHTTNKKITNIRYHNIKKRNTFNAKVFRAEINPCRIIKENLEGFLEKILNDLPIKGNDFLGRTVNKQQVVKTVANQLKSLFTTSQLNDEIILKNDIINIIQDVPLEIHGCNKISYLNKLADELLNNIKNGYVVYKEKHRTQRTKKIGYCHNKPYILKKYIQHTEEEMKVIVKEELEEFFETAQLKICPKLLKDIEMEIIDILVDSMEAIRFGNDEQLKEQIAKLLCELGRLTENQAINFTNVMFEHLAEMFCIVEEQIQKPEFQAFVVLQNTNENNRLTQNANQPNLTDMSDFSISGITEGDINANLDLYIARLTEQIDQWLTNILGPTGDDKHFREVVVNDLAGDIVDRLKYLELNPSSRGTDADELEHLKYQIFKWINKLVGDDNMDTIDHASELMQRIRSIPVPLLSIPQQIISKSLPSCCEIPSNLSPRGGRDIKLETPQDVSSSVDVKSSNPQNTDKIMVEITNKKGTPNGIQISPSSITNIPNDRAGNESKNKELKLGPNNHPPGEGMRKEFGPNATTERKFSVSDTIASKSMQNNNKGRMSISQMPMFGSHGPGGSMTEALHSATSNRRLSAPSGYCNELPGKTNVNEISYFRSTGEVGTIAVSHKTSPRRLSNTVKMDYAELPCGICSRGTEQLPPATPSRKQLNDEFDEYVKTWVQQVPIATSGPDDETLAEKARLGLYNGIWKAITKLKLNPATFNNLFYYQDLLDDEIEELLNFLPQTPEMLKKKHLLKAQLIEKTTHTTELILTSAAPASFRQQIVENVSNTLPRAAVAGSVEQISPAQLYEELQKLNLAEDFILYTSFKEDDKIKANVYRKKLLKTVEELVEAVKTSHGKDLKDIDAGIYIDDIMSALHKVPLPSEETIREEADEILLGIEIEQWYSDLPLIPNDDYLEQLYQRRHRNALVKKIHAMENEMNSEDKSFEGGLKIEISKFLQRVPLEDGQIVNKDFMVDELVNRLKNRPKDLSKSRKKSVAFEIPFDYEDFSKRIPLCSSYSGLPADQQSSYMIVDGTRVNDATHYYQMKQPDTIDSDQQWLTLQDSQASPCNYSVGLQPAIDRTASLGHHTFTGRPPQVMQGPQQDEQWLTKEDSRGPLCKICSQRGGQLDQQAMSERPENSPFKQFLQASLGHKSREPRFDNKAISNTQTQQQMSQSSQVTNQSQTPYYEFQQIPGIQISSQKHLASASNQTPGPYKPVGHQDTGIQGIQNIMLDQSHLSGGKGLVDQRRHSPRRIRQVSSIIPMIGSQEPSRSIPVIIDGSENIIHNDVSPEFYRLIRREGNQYIEHDRGLPRATSPGNISIYDQPPVGFSTPQQFIPQGKAPRLGRKRTRETEMARRDAARRRLDLEDLEEEGIDRELDEEPCRCMERSWICRQKRPLCYACDDFDMDFPPCMMALRYPYHYY